MLELPCRTAQSEEVPTSYQKHRALLLCGEIASTLHVGAFAIKSSSAIVKHIVAVGTLLKTS